MQRVRQVRPHIYRYIPVSRAYQHIHIFQRGQDLLTAVLPSQFFLKDPVDDQCRETGHEVCRDPVLPAKVHWPCPELALHDPEALLDLPAPVVDL